MPEAQFGFDGNLVDTCAVIFGGVCVFVRPMQRYLNNKKLYFSRNDCIFDFLNGTSLLAFGLLTATVFSNHFLYMVLQAKLSIAVAGVVGIIFLLGEFFNDVN